jgi:hypothetical protein
VYGHFTKTKRRKRKAVGRIVDTVRQFRLVTLARLDADSVGVAAVSIIITGCCCSCSFSIAAK